MTLQLAEWDVAVASGTNVLAALSNVAGRLPVMTAAVGQATRASVVDPVLAAACPDIGQRLLDKHLLEAEAQLANLRLVVCVPPARALAFCCSRWQRPGPVVATLPSHPPAASNSTSCCCT